MIQPLGWKGLGGIVSYEQKSFERSKPVCQLLRKLVLVPEPLLSRLGSRLDSLLELKRFEIFYPQTFSLFPVRLPFPLAFLFLLFQCRKTILGLIYLQK
jgi:hypothetical protein